MATNERIKRQKTQSSTSNKVESDAVKRIQARRKALEVAKKQDLGKVSAKSIGNTGNTFATSSGKDIKINTPIVPESNQTTITAPKITNSSTNFTRTIETDPGKFRVENITSVDDVRDVFIDSDPTKGVKQGFNIGILTEDQQKQFQQLQLASQQKKTVEDLSQEKISRLDKKLQEAEEIKKLQEEQEARDIALSEQQIRGAESALESAFATGREGPSISTKGQLTTEAKKQATDRLLSLDNQRRRLEIQRESAFEDLQEAIDNAKLEEQEALRDRLAGIDQQIFGLEQQIELEGQQTTDTALAISDQLNTFLTPENLPNMSVGAITDIVTAQANLAGLAPEQTQQIIQQKLARKTLADEIAKAKTPEQQEGLLGLFNSLGISPTTDVQRAGALELLQNQLNDGEITQEQFQTRRGILIGADQITPLDEQIKFYELQEQKAKSEQERLKAVEMKGYLEEQGFISGNQPSVIDKLAVAPVGETAPRAQGMPKEFEGQCSAYVNDILGAKPGDTNFFGSSLSEKKSRINNFDINNPMPGDVFVASFSSGDEIGHVGFIESVNGDGTVTLVDQNRNNQQKVNRRTVPIASLKEQEGVMGYFSSVKDSRTKKTQAQRDLDSIEAGTIDINDLGQKRRDKVAPLAASRQKELLERNDIEGVMRASAFNQKDVSDSTANSFEKAFTVVQQISNLGESILQGVSPDSQLEPDSTYKKAGQLVEGIVASVNPFDTEARGIQSQLIAIVPNLARGIFGEVGVLTDTDIRTYQQTLPNLRQTDDVKIATTALILRTVKNSLDTKVRTQAGLGRDVSGLVTQYNEVSNKIQELESQLPTQGLQSSIEAEDVFQKYSTNLTSISDKYQLENNK